VSCKNLIWLETKLLRRQRLLSDARRNVRLYSRIKDRKSPIKGSRPSVPHGTNFDIMHNAHLVVTCSWFVVNDIYQWKTLQRSFIKKVYQIPDRANKTEAETMRQSRGRGSKVETEARPCEAEARPSQLKKLPRGRLELRQMPRGLHPCILARSSEVKGQSERFWGRNLLAGA